MSSKKSLPEWDSVLSAAAHLQELIPDAVLVGGTAVAAYARHRVSTDADHVLTDLKKRFDEILAQLESVAGWKTARVNRPVLILGSLDGIETGIRQLIREKPLETNLVEYKGIKICMPTEAELLRIKAALILKRNATRDYLDFTALAQRLGNQKTKKAFQDFDSLYPQENGESPLQQLQIQLSNPMPFDLDQTALHEYKKLVPEYQDWNHVKELLSAVALSLFEEID